MKAMDTPIDLTEAAKIAYSAYGKTTDYKNYQGNPMPKFEDLPEAIRNAWINASAAVLSIEGTTAKVSG